MQSRWVYQLGVLHTALEQLEALHEQWLTTRDSLPANAQPGTPVFDGALAEHLAESWNYLDDWGTHAGALHEINSAATKAPSPLAPPPTTVPAPGRAAAVRR